MDFFLGIMARSILEITSTKFIGKSELFRWPYGIIFRALGGQPVERTKDNNLVEAVVEMFNRRDKFSIALAPEGTRSKVKRLKTGFYHIARQANIPIYPVGFDFSTKTIIINKPLFPTDDIEQDFRLLLELFSNIKGKYPNLGVDMDMLESTIEGQE
jgi:1-acyl-sn-glycerol-3-phosphate acyltransferase